MLTELFVARYRESLLDGSARPAWLTRLQAQMAHLFVDDLLPLFSDSNAACHELHQRLARELGVFELAPGLTMQERCARYLGEPYDIWNNAHRDLDYFFKSRLSLMELALRLAEEQRSSTNRASGGLFSAVRSARATSSAARDPLKEAISEFNSRLGEAGVPFRYHRGFIQEADDPLTTKEIEDPFWALIEDDAWKNVALDIQEAIDRRDTARRDSALYAAKALESTIKIISDARGVTKKTERGAADFISNLASVQFIASWEGELLKAFFSKVRNPHGHGPGAEPMPSLTREQETWVLDASMSWIKSLVRRT